MKMYIYIFICTFVTTAFAMDLRNSGCNYNGMTYKDGETIETINGANDPCNNCRCENGDVMCYRTICASLPCSKEDRYIPKGKCCPVCKETDDTDEEKEKTTDSSENGEETGVGNLDCSNVVCSNLLCSLEQSVVPVGHCCPKCIGSKQPNKTWEENESSAIEDDQGIGGMSEDDGMVLDIMGNENKSAETDDSSDVDENIGDILDNLFDSAEKK